MLKIKKMSMPLMSFVLMSMLNACSNGEGSSSPSIPPKPSTTLNWIACDSTSKIDSKLIQSLGARLSCATMKAPLDYFDLSKGTIDVALARVSAGNTQARRGAIFFNPGGPGGDGLELGADFGSLWINADITNPIGKNLKAISEQYDLIGFSPRGVGRSTNLTCSSDSTYSFVNFLSDDRRAANLQNEYNNLVLYATACRSNNITPYINTDATARDMDLARELMGDKKLSYIGYSYGTFLGAWYVSLFPYNVDKIILDSNVDFRSSLPEGFINQPQAMQYIFDNIISPYIAINSNYFDLGISTDDIRKIFSTLPTDLKQIVSNKIYSPLFNVKNAQKVGSIIAAANGFSTILKNNPGINENEAKAAIIAYRFSSDTEANEIFMNVAIEMNKAYFNIKGSYKVQLNAEDAVNLAVKCNDMVSPTDPTYWNDIGNKLAIIAPLLGGSATSNNCTTTWGGPTVNKPDLINALQAPAILMVQTQFDGATPLGGALKSLDYLTNAKMIYIIHDYTHGAFPYGTECVDGAVSSYILTGAMPSSKQTTCIGHSLNLNNSIENRFDKGAIGSVYKDPTKAKENIDKIRNTITNAERINTRHI